jgi:uncharacterized oxidoreductase
MGFRELSKAAFVEERKNMKLAGNTILITGGTSGIGLAFAEKLIEIGNTVIICGRREDRLTALKKKHPSMITHTSDVSKATDRQSLYEWVIQSYPAVNMLINNAGIQLVTDLTKPVNLNRVQGEIDINLVAPIHLSSLFAGHFSLSNDAAIVNISSGLAFAPIAFMPVYCATKAAIHSLTLSLRYQLRNTVVKVFEIIPPSVDTELGHDRRADKTQTHGGIHVNEFLQEAIDGLEKDEFECAVGQSKGLRLKREELFHSMNERISH